MAQKNIDSPLPDQNALKSKLFEIIEQKKGMQYNAPPTWTTYHSPDDDEIINTPDPAPEDLHGAPPGWDWRNAQADWEGNPLPDGAQSFDKYGDPYYGPGLKGVWNKIRSMWGVKTTNDPDRGIFAIEQQDLINEETGEKIGTMPGPNLAKTWENVKSGEAGKVPAGIAKGIETATAGVLGLFNEPAIASKKTFSAAAEVGRVTGGNRRGIFTDYINSRTPEQLKTDNMSGRDIPETYYTADGETLKEAWDRGWHAGAILYSSAFDVSLRAEYIKALDSGDVDPDLLAMEFENPLAEMAGEMIFDPLNIPIGRVLTAEKRIKNAYQLFVKPIDGWTTAFKALETASNDTEKFERMADITKITASAVKKSAAGLDNYANSHKFFGLTADGKRYVVGRSSGEVYAWLAKNVDPDKPDEAIEMFKAMAKIGSGDEKEIAEAMKTLTNYRKAVKAGKTVGKNFTLAPLVSKAGREAAIILNKLMDADFLDELAAAQKTGVDGVEKFINRRMEGAVSEMFPSIDDLVKRRADALAQIEKGKSVVVTKKAQMTMDGFEAVVDGQQVIVPPKVADWLLAVNKLNNGAQKVVSPFNKFFAYIYMGLSPGYAFRNLAQDMLVGTVDFGIKTITKTPSQIIQNGVEWIGGVTPGAVGGFGGPAAAFIQSQVKTNGTKLVDALKKMDARVAAGVFEEWSSMRVVGTAVEDAMLRMMKPGRAIPDYGELIAAGMPDEMADFITQALIRNKGDVKKAMAEARKVLKLGGVDAFRVVKITDAEASTLTRLGIHDDILNAVDNAVDPADFRAKKDDIIRQAREFAAKTSDEVTPHLPEDETVEALAEVIDELPDQRAKELADAYHVANQRTMGAYADVLSDLRKLAPDDPDIRAMDGVLDDTAYNAILERMHRRAYNAKMVSNKIFVKGANLDEIWSAAPLHMPGPAPKTPAEFKDRIWREYYFEVATSTWNKYRDDLAEAVENIARKVGKQDSEALVKARKELAEARKWDSVQREDEVRIALLRAKEKGSNKDMVFIIANQYGVPSVTEGGAKMDQRILDTVNKYSEQKFDSLDDITDPEVVRKAFNARIADVPAQKVATGSDAAQAPVAPVAKTPKGKDLSSYAPATQKFFAPRKELEATPYGKVLSERIKAEASTMLSEYGGTTRVPVGDKAPGIWVTRSNNPEWYKTIYWEGSKNKDAVFNALKRIIDDEGKDLIKPRDETILRVKQEILGRLAGGDEWGNPPDLAYMLWTGRTDEAAISYGKMQAQMNAASGADLSFGVTNLQDTFPWLDETTMAKLEGRYFDIVGELDQGDYKNTAEIMRKSGRYTEEEIDARLLDDWMQQNVKPVYAEEGSEALAVIEPELVDPVMPVTTKPKKPYSRGTTPTQARATEENLEGLEQLLTRIADDFEAGFGNTVPVESNPALEKALRNWELDAEEKISEARLIAANVGNAARDFTVLSYPQKTYADLALAYLYPYHFWYSRSYAHWMQRIVTQPGVVAAYAKYRKTLEKIHAGAPDWYKYQINSNELLGIDSDSPLFFNLEATLNPLNGLVGVDFMDARKRKDFYTTTLDDLNKFGPSTWTPFSWAAAIHMKRKGEDDAAARWAGRLLPATSTVKAGLSALNINIDTLGGINEFDPMVQIFSGGIDPYERDRVGRALGWMVERGEIDAATAIDAGYAQDGEVWREALRRAIHSRAGGQLSSFFLGVGFKARNVSDIQIDRFYTEQYRLVALKSTLHPDEYRRMWDGLRDKYPFMDTVILAKKHGAERDEALAYNVLGRIPPGSKTTISKAAGIDPRLFDKFYENKGDMTGWAETDKQKFMAAVVDIGAILNIPTSATRAEWTDASIAYGKIAEDGKKQFGDAIAAMEDHYYGLGEDTDAKREYMDANPILGDYLDFKSGQIMANPLLKSYYAGIEYIQRYYNSFMYARITETFGDDIYDLQDAYYDIFDPSEKKKFLKANPRLKKFWDMRDEQEKLVAEMTVSTGKKLKEGIPAELRKQLDDQASIGEEDIAGAVNQPRVPEYYQYSYKDWMQNFQPEMQRLLEDYIYGGKDLPYAANNELEYFANNMGEDPEIILELIEQSAR